MPKKIRIAVFAILVGVFLGSYSIGAAYKMSEQEAQSFLQDFQSATEGIDAFGIFFHNLTDTLPMFVPGFGLAWGSYVAWSTGAAFNALLSQNHLLSRISPLVVFLVSPFGIMELVAYSIGMSRSLLLIFAIVRRRGTLKHELKTTGIEIGIVIGLLLAAAFVESYMVLQGTHNGQR